MRNKKVFDTTMILMLCIRGVILGGVYALLAAGLNLVFGVMRIPNMSQGAFVMLGMYAAYWLYTLFGIDVIVSLPITFLIFFLSGIFMKYLIQPVTKAEAPPLLITYGMMLILVNAAQLVWSGLWRSVNVPYRTMVYRFGPTYLSLPEIIAFTSSVLIFSILYLLLMKTTTGMAIRALVQNEPGAFSLGINVEKYRSVAIGLGVGLSGTGGALFSLTYSMYPYIGTLFTLKLLICCVLGGLGSVSGALCGALIIGLAETISILFVPYDFKDAIGLMLFLLILILRPAGLLGKTRV
jgi:branched-chain amino acid transport system permease protein